MQKKNKKQSFNEMLAGAKKRKKQLLSGILAVAMAVSQMAPITALADDFESTDSAFVDGGLNEGEPVITAGTPTLLSEQGLTTPDANPVEGTTATGETAAPEENPAEPEAPADETAAAVTAVKDLIAALPEGGDITEETLEDVTAQLTAIDEALEGLSDEQKEQLDMSRYQAAVAAVTSLTDMDVMTLDIGDEAMFAANTNYSSIMPAATMASVWAGNTEYGNVTFARGQSQENFIELTVNATTRTYGDEYSKPGIKVEVNGTEQQSEDVRKALAEATITMYGSAAQDKTTPAGSYGAYVDCTTKNVTINGINYAIRSGSTTVSQNIHVNTKQITVYAIEGYQNQGMDRPPLKWYTDGLINGDQLAGSPSCNTDRNTPVGDYDILKGTLENPNYTIDFITAKLHVVANTVIVTANVLDGDAKKTEFTREYGKSNPTLSYTVTGLSSADEAALANGEKKIEDILGGTPIVETDATSTSAPGDYKLTVSGINAAHGDYEIACVEGVLHVTTRKVSVNIGSLDKLYGDADPAHNTNMLWGDGTAVTMSNTSKPLSDDGKEMAGISYKIDREPGEDVGTYGLVGSISDDNTSEFYSVSFTHGTLTVKPATITVTLDNINAIYGETRNGAIKEITGYKSGEDYDDVFGKQQPIYSATGNNYAAGGLDKKAPVGEYVLTAYFASAPTNYLVEFVPGTITVTARPMTITVTPGQSKVYGEADKTFAVSYTAEGMGKVDGDFTSAVVTRTPGENVDEYAYSIEQFEAANESSNYTLTLKATDKFQITKKTLEVLIPDATKVYGEENPNLVDLVSYNGFVDNASLGISDNAENSLGGQLVITHEATKTSPVGKYNITGSGLTSANYDIVYKGTTRVSTGEMTITPLAVQVKGNDLSRKYNVLDATKAPSYEILNATGTAAVSVVDPEGSPLVITATCPQWSDITAAKGEYPVTIAVEPNANYTIEIIDGHCTIYEGDVAVIATSQNVVYGDMSTNDIVETLTVTGISAQDGTKYYHNGELITNVGYVHIGIAQNGSTNVSNDNATLNVGTYDITISITPLDGKEDSYTIDGLNSGAGRLTVSRRPVTFTVTPGQQKVFGDKDPVFDMGNVNFGTWTGGNAIADPRTDLAGATAVRLAGENVGNYPFISNNADEQPLGGNYNVTLVSNSFKIVPRPVTGTITNKSKIYGDVFADKDYSIVWDGFINNDDKNAINSAVAFVCVGAAETAEVGQYDIGATYSSNDNYTVIINRGTMTVTPRPLSLTFVDTEKVYGDADPDLNALYTVAGNIANTGRNTLALSNGALAGSVTRAEGEDVGKYDIKTNLSNKNYEITYVTSSKASAKADGDEQNVAALTIKPATLTVTVAGPYQTVYGDKLPTFCVNYTGFKRGETESVLSGELKFIDVATGEAFPDRPNVGQYEVRAQGLENTAAENYLIEYVDSTLDVTPRDITLTADDATKVYGDKDPVFTYTVTEIPGFKLDEGDLAGIHVERPDAALENHAGENVGDHELVVVGLDDNFKMTANVGHLTITPKELEVSMVVDTIRTYGDENPVLDINDLSFDGFVNSEELGIEDDITVLSDSELVFSFTDGEGNDATVTSHVTDAGSVIASKLENSAAENYTFTYKAGKFVINPRPLTWDIGETMSVYGNDIKSFNNTLSYKGAADKNTIVNGDDLGATIVIKNDAGKEQTAPAISKDDAEVLVVNLDGITIIHDNGTYTLTPKTTNTDYDVTMTAGTYKVVERLLTVTITEPLSGDYGKKSENPVFDVSIKAESSPKLPGDDISEPPVVDGDDIGLTMDVEFTAFENSALTAKPTATYDAKAGKFTTTDVKNAGVYTWEPNTDFQYETPDGNYDITVEFKTADGDTDNGQYVIKRKDVAVSMNPAQSEKNYGEATMVPELVYNGFEYDETEKTITMPPFEVVTDSRVVGNLGAEGVYTNAFTYSGGEFDNYKFSACQSDLTVTRLKVDALPDGAKVVLEGAVANDDGTTATAIPEDEFKTTWSVSDVNIKAPAGYSISSSDALEGNTWAAALVVSEVGKEVSSIYFLRNNETGAITTMGEKTVNIDKTAPSIVAVDVTNEYNSENKVNIFNNEFKPFNSTIKVFLTGKETEVRKTNEDVAADAQLLKAVLSRFARAADNTVPTASATSTCANDPNSGVKSLECYTVSKNEAAFSENGAMVVDNAKFKEVEVNYVDANTAYASIDVSPDFEGYIVTRTRDASGQYSTAAVASVSVIAPKSHGGSDPEPTAAPTATPAPYVAPYVAPVARTIPQTGITATQYLAVALVGIAAVGGVLFIVVKKKGKKQAGEETEVKTEDKPEDPKDTEKPE